MKTNKDREILENTKKCPWIEGNYHYDRFVAHFKPSKIREMLDEIERLKKERDEARELAWDMFNQACRVTQDNVKYDHMCLGPYECVQEKLIKWGLIKKEECVR